jgi:KUP system potassium uptake protein
VRRRRRSGSLLALTIGAIGVVYGDLGTSPLYAFRDAFSAGSGARATRADVLGVLSLIVWSLLVVVSLKYAILIMRADNDGEGGILALLALVLRGARPRSSDVSHLRRRNQSRALVVLGLLGAALLFGDGVITPAISVLSAVEGLSVAAPSVERYTVAIAFIVLLALFTFQRRGTARVGRAFAPVMLVWFGTIAVLGARAIAWHPEVLAAFSPTHAVQYFVDHGWAGLRILGAMALVITGTEALFADIGHFGTTPIRIGWFGFILPSLLINYLGQGAVVLSDPNAVSYPFFHLVSPQWRVPLVVLATGAAIIASQGLISASFSLARQAVQLDLLPRLTIVHTSPLVQGQIYLPMVNAALACLCLLVVLGFRSSIALSAAFGIAVTLTMAITTILFCVLARARWRWPAVLVYAIGGGFLIVDVAFFGANLLKFRQGGWLPLLLATVAFTVMSTWRAGHRAVRRAHASHSMPIARFLALVRQQRPHRSRGSAVFLTSRPHRASRTLVEHLEHVHAIHQRTVLLTVAPSRRPVLWGNRVSVRRHALGISSVVVRYGFVERPDLAAVLAQLEREQIVDGLADVTFYVERDILVTSGGGGMWRWRKRLFAFMARNARPPWEFFGMPTSRVIEFGSEVRLGDGVRVV